MCFLLCQITESLQLFSTLINSWFCAYLDPGTGSFIIQILVASFFGMILAIKLFWSNIKIFLTKLFSKKQDSVKDEN